MTDLTFPPSARRFASFLDREYCVWMPSLSVALLSALVTGKGRPKRLLVEENAPAFVSNIGLVTGAAPVKVSPPRIDEVLEGLLQTEGLSPAHVWGVATHRGGDLSPTDWLSRCAALGLPTIELCSGSLFALARWGRSPAMFTIVDLNAEEAFVGTQLSALLTGDRAAAARVQRLCLPGPEAQDYVFDAGPRGLEHDEPALMSLVERATGQGVEKSPATGDPPPSVRFWARLFRSGEGDSSARTDGPETAAAAIEADLWRSRLAEAEAGHAEALRTAAASASSLQSRLDEQLSLAEQWQQQLRATESDADSRAERDSQLLSESRNKLDEMQRAIDQWEARFLEAESEAARDATILSTARAELLEQKSGSERALASLGAERDALAQKLARTERERDLAVADAGRRDESERKTLSELQRQVEQLERDAKSSADREARQKKSAEASRTKLSAQVARLEKEAADFDRARADLLKRKTEVEQALASVQPEKEALARKLKDLDAELSETLADSAKRAAAQRTALDEQAQRAAQLERDVADLTAREAAHVREGKASQTGLSKRIAEMEGEKEVLANRLWAVESGRDKAMADAARRTETQISAIAEQREREERLEAEAAALKEREARLTEEGARERAGLSEQASRWEAEASLAQKASDELRAEKAEAARALARARAEGKAAAKKLAEAERGHAQALADAVGSREALRFSLTERITHLEADSALAEKAREELAAQAEEFEQRHALLLSEKEELGRRLAGVEDERDRALLEVEERSGTLRAALEEQAQRAERSEGHATVQSEREAEQAQAGESKRAVMSDRIARLEASLAEAENTQTDVLSGMAAEAERAAASMPADVEATARKLAETEKDRADDRAEAARREETQRAAFEEQRRRADQLEKDASDRTERETRLVDEWALQRAEMSDRIARMEAAGAAADSARMDLVAQKAEGDLALASIRAEKAALGATLARLERDHTTAQGDAANREDAQRQALDAERERAERLEKDAAALVERESKKLNGALEALESEWSERLRQALAALQAEGEGLVTKVAEVEQERDRAQTESTRREEAHSAKIEELEQRAHRIMTEAAVAAEREHRQAETREASRAELVVRLARLEADAVLSDKARTELLNRKRDSDRALAEAQDERAALFKKLAVAEHALDRAQARAAQHEEPQRERGVGGASVEDGQVPSGAAAPGDSPKAAGERSTGGLSALINLWNTALISRPAGRKETEAEPPDPPVNPAFDIEVTPAEALSSSGPGPIRPTQKEEARGKPDRPRQRERARPNQPRRPRPKPAPEADDTEKQGGWLQRLARRLGKKE